MKKAFKNQWSVIFMAFVILGCSEESNLQLADESENVQKTPLKSSESSVQAQPKTIRRILSFNFDSLGVVGQIKTTQSIQETSEISLVVPDGTDLTSLTPTIIISPDATSVSPASGVANDFSHTQFIAPYQVEGPAPFFKRNYEITVTYENDFLVYDSLDLTVAAGSSFTLTGNFGLPATDYKATFVKPDVDPVVTDKIEIIFQSSLRIYTPSSLVPGKYQVKMSRGNIEKVIGFITVI
jgi:hypothetical protein